MSQSRDILATPDQRNSNQRHKLHKFSVRVKQNKNQTPLHYSSRTPKHTRLAARSSKRKELTTGRDIFDEDLHALDDDRLDDRSASKKSTEFTLRYAIDICDPDFLTILMRQSKMNHDRDKHQSNGSDRSKTRHKHTILTHAIDRGDSDCIRVILDNIFCGYIYPTIIEHVCSNGRTALWYACSKGNIDLVRELVERGHATINKCGVLIVAAQNGHEKIVDYLLSKGCDPNRRTKNYNERALHAASRRNHLGITNALLKHGADPTILDYKKRTALDYAIHKRHIEIAKVLISNQDGHFVMNKAGFTPLMLAAYCNNTPIVDILLDILPREQTVDELVLLACRYTIDGGVNNRDKAYCYFEKALSITTPLCSNTPCEAYEYLSECQTFDELAHIRDNDNRMRMHALLVSERLLLKSGQVNHLVSLIFKQSNVYKWHGIFHRCLQLQIHAYQLVIQTEHNHWCNNELHKYYLFGLVNILSKILHEEDTVPVNSLALIWAWVWALDRADKTSVKILFKLVFITIYLIEWKRVDANGQRILLGLIQRAVRPNIIVRDGYSLLGYFINTIAYGQDVCTYAAKSLPVLSIIRLLLQCGADVDAVDSTKSTPLHRIATCHEVDTARSVISLLLDANAHMDCIDNNGFQPEDVAWEFEIKELLRANRKLSLKCRCAHLINLENVYYANFLSSNLIRFVRMHSKYNQY